VKKLLVSSYVKIHRLAVYATIVALGLALVPVSSISAAQITARSLTLASSASNATTTHTYKFTVASGTAIKSVRFRYCTTATGACTTPNAWVNTAATLGSTTGLGTGFGVDLATNADSVSVTSATNVTAPTSPITINITTVKNPTLTTQPFSFYVRMFTYSDNAYTTGLDSGVVAATINTQIAPPPLVVASSSTKISRQPLPPLPPLRWWPRPTQVLVTRSPSTARR
jgi:hypothetical protein